MGKSKKTTAPVGEKVEEAAVPSQVSAEPVKLVDPDDKKKEELEQSKVESKKKLEADCRLCLYYPFKSTAITTRLTDSLLRATSHFTRTFCGEKPFLKDKSIASELDCVGKTFKSLESDKPKKADKPKKSAD